jgi:polyisoprenoid-binding protein YceI
MNPTVPTAASVPARPPVRGLIALTASLACFAPWPAAARVYEAIPGESTLTYRLEHTTHTVKGVSRDFICRVELTPDTLSSKVVVSAAVKSFDSGNDSRDDHALETVRAMQHPRVEFASDSVHSAPGGYRVYGVLDFAGRRRPIDFLVTPKRGPGKVGVTGGFTVKLSDYDVKPPKLLFLKVQDEMEIRFDVSAEDR